LKKQLNLSKSLYTRGLQCSKSLWLKKYKEDVLTAPNEAAKAIFETGNVVGDLACRLFPDGKEVPYEGTTFSEKIALTQQWMDEGVENIYEATFSYQDVLVMVDILHKADDGSWEIYEVKSSTWHEKKSRNKIAKYIPDASIQYYVLNGVGLNVSKTSVTLLNSHYTFQQALDVHGLFSHVDISAEVLALQEAIPAHLKTFHSCLSDTSQEPDIDIGSHCKSPYPCDASDYCWKKQRNIPDYSVFNIFSMGKKPIDLYEKGIIEVEDIPDEAMTTEKQRFVVDAWVNKTTIVDKPAIQHFLDGLTFPIYHLDFETFQAAVPTFDHQRPFQQICFQYSLHIEHADKPLEHKEFLAKEGEDPRRALIERLISDLPEDVTILVFNESFEKKRIEEMVKDFPEYAEQLMRLHNNIVDLAVPFQKRYYYDYKLEGKYSIKLVMPLLVPEMADAYKQLRLVQNGGDAMNTFPKLNTMDAETKLEYREALLKYCELDTLAMVKILAKLRHIV